MNNVLNSNILIKFGGMVLLTLLSILFFSIFTQDVKGEGGLIEINTIEDLDNIRDDLEGGYILMRDLDFNDPDDWDDHASNYNWIMNSSFEFVGKAWLGTVYNTDLAIQDGENVEVYVDSVKRDPYDAGVTGGWQVTDHATGEISFFDVDGNPIRPDSLYGVNGSRDVIVRYVGDNEDELGFGPIGQLDPFTGTFDGNEFVIRNLNINRGADYVGLFAKVSGDSGAEEGVIKNIGLEGGSVVGRSYVGSLVGSTEGGEILNSYSTVNVSSLFGDNLDFSIGGLIGYSNSAVSNSYATGDVSAVDSWGWIGGLIGASNSAVSDSYATGEVYAPGAKEVGGLIGSIDSGWESDGEVRRSYATGDVTGGDISHHTSLIGGFAGLALSGNIFGSYATGNVTSYGHVVGGFVGEAYNIISNSYSTGNVSGEEGVWSTGGFVGEVYYIISNSYSTGNVSGGAGLVGGFAGNNESFYISNSFSTGGVSGDVEYSEVGGFAGQSFDNLTNSYFLNHAGNPSDCMGGGDDSGCTAIADPNPGESYFFAVANSPMDEWDFTNIWSDSNNGSDYPILAWQFTPPVPTSSRSSSKPSHSVTLPSTGEGSQSTSYKQGTAISINAPIKAGHTFLHWEDGEGNIVSTNRIYSFIVGGDMEVHPVYVEDGEQTEEKDTEEIIEEDEDLSEPQRQIISLMRSLISLLQQRLEMLLSQVGN